MNTQSSININGVEFDDSDIRRFGVVMHNGVSYQLTGQAQADQIEGVFFATAIVEADIDADTPVEYYVYWDFGEEIYMHDLDGNRMVTVDGHIYIDETGNTSSYLAAPLVCMDKVEREEFLSRHWIGYEYTPLNCLPWYDFDYIYAVREC